MKTGYKTALLGWICGAPLNDDHIQDFSLNLWQYTRHTEPQMPTMPKGKKCAEWAFVWLHIDGWLSSKHYYFDCPICK